MSAGMYSLYLVIFCIVSMLSVSIRSAAWVFTARLAVQTIIRLISVVVCVVLCCVSCSCHLCRSPTQRLCNNYSRSWLQHSSTAKRSPGSCRIWQIATCRWATILIFGAGAVAHAAVVDILLGLLDDSSAVWAAATDRG